jgi:hypothetical protein
VLHNATQSATQNDKDEDVIDGVVLQFELQSAIQNATQIEGIPLLRNKTKLNNGKERVKKKEVAGEPATSFSDLFFLDCLVSFSLYIVPGCVPLCVSIWDITCDTTSDD